MGQVANRSYRVGDVPVTGYQLQQFLGRGGFGEVWKATGPGGVTAAIKIIYDLDRKKGGKELKALRLLRDIRHPNLVPLTAFWLKSSDGELVSADSLTDFVDSGIDARGTLQTAVDTATAVASATSPAELVIAMGLAEKSLFDRLRECRDEGRRGVPPDELLTYMEDAARAIDLLNNKHGIEHCDIKPQNILLLSGAAQVCDFGLAKMVGEVRETSMGAGTIAYGAPEILFGKGPTATTDQYSLAISYFELRTGELPFASERISDVLGAKQDGNVDLSLLPESERQVIERAVAVEPANRFKNCGEMVRALRACVAEGMPLSDRPLRPLSLTETQNQRTTTSIHRLAIRRQRFWNRIAIGTIAAMLFVGCAAWISTISLRTTEEAAEKLAEAEQALVIAEKALEHANQMSEERSHQAEEPIHVQIEQAPVESTKPIELRENKPASEATAVTPATESTAVTPTTPTQPDIPPADVPPKETEHPTPQPPAPTVEVEDKVSSLAGNENPATPNSEPVAESSPPAAIEQVATAAEPVEVNSKSETAPTESTPVATQPTVTSTPTPTTPPAIESRPPAQPVRLSAQLTSDAWIITVSIAEPTKQIWSRFGENGEFESTGFQDIVSQLSSSRQPNKHLTLPLNSDVTQVFIKYLDVRGNMRGPFELTFSPQRQRAIHGEQMLKGFPRSWISFGESKGQPVAYFTQLLAHRYALSEIRYSVNSDSLDQIFPLPEATDSNPHSASSENRTFIELPGSNKYVAVQLTFADGEKSKVERFESK